MLREGQKQTRGRSKSMPVRRGVAVSTYDRCNQVLSGVGVSLARRFLVSAKR